MAENESLNLNINTTQSGLDINAFNQKLRKETQDSYKLLKDAYAGEQSAVKKLNDEYSKYGRKTSEIAKEEKAAAVQKAQLAKEQANLTKAVFGGVAAWDLLKKGLSLLTGAFTDLIKSGAEYQSTMMNLATVANNFGQSSQKATSAARSLAQDGLITVSTAATSLKSLLAGGLNIDQATNLITKYKDEAAIGRASTIDMDTAVGNLAESFLTEQSMIGNLSGQQENYNNIIQIGANEMGKSVKSLTAQERAMAKYLGTLQVAQKAQHGTEIASMTLTGAMNKFDNTVQMLKYDLGVGLAPAATLVYTELTRMVSGFDANITGAGQLGTTASTTGAGGLSNFAIAAVNTTAEVLKLTVQVGGLIGKLGNLGQSLGFIAGTTATGAGIGAIVGGVGAIPGAIGGALAGLTTVLVSGTQNQKVIDNQKNLANQLEQIEKDKQASIERITKNGLDGSNNLFSKLGNAALSDYSTNTGETLKKLAEMYRDYLQSVEKEINSYNKNVAKSNSDYTSSLKELVIAHRETTDELKSDIQSLNEDYSTNLKEMADSYQEWLDDTNKSYSRTNEDYQSDLADEQKAYEEKVVSIKENLAKQLAMAHDADETLIALAKKQIAEETTDYQDKVDDLNKEYQRDTEDYNDAVDKKKDSYQKDVKNAEDSYKEKLSTLQASLDEEMALQRKYADEFAQFKDAVAEDDITRLKNQLAAELSEMKSAHEEKLVELKREYEEDVAAKGGTTTGSTTTSSSKSTTTSSGNVNTSIVDYLKSLGKNSSYSYRATLASKYGIGNYTGTASQNTQLLSILKSKNASEFATGGIVTGVGAQPIVAHGGEMILNSSQIQKLFDLLAGKSNGGFSNTNSIGQVIINDKMDIETLISKLSFNYRTRSDLI